jgi:phage FluMu gp28-like protein
MTTATSQPGKTTRTSRKAQASGGKPITALDAVRAAIAEGRLFAPRSYQAQRLASPSRFNLDNWSRQTGKSQTAAQDATHLAATTGESVMVLSASQDLTKEFMVKVADYAPIFCGLAADVQRDLRRAVAAGEMDELLYVDDQGVRITQTVITLPNGERIIGRPANPRTARGFSMHVYLDEFGMHKDPDEIWAAAFPSITSRNHLRLNVMSTPGLRSDDKFADLVQAAIRGESDFRYMQVTIHDAIAAGLFANAEELRRNLRDEDKWRREYLCEFVDAAGAFLNYELIRACEHEGIQADLPANPEDWTPERLGWDPNAGSLYAGIDIGRRHDLTCIWLLQMVGDVAWTRACVELRRVPFAAQEAVMLAILDKLPVRRVCADNTGLGMMLVEQLRRVHGSTVEPVTFTARVKADLAEPLRRRFEDRLIRVPVKAEIREDLHSIQRTVTAAGNVRYLGERTEDGHADRFWALALANHAVEAAPTIRWSFH